MGREVKEIGTEREAFRVDFIISTAFRGEGKSLENVFRILFEKGEPETNWWLVTDTDDYFGKIDMLYILL